MVGGLTVFPHSYAGALKKTWTFCQKHFNTDISFHKRGHNFKPEAHCSKQNTTTFFKRGLLELVSFIRLLPHWLPERQKWARRFLAFVVTKKLTGTCNKNNQIKNSSCACLFHSYHITFHRFWLDWPYKREYLGHSSSHCQSLYQFPYRK